MWEVDRNAIATAAVKQIAAAAKQLMEEDLIMGECGTTQPQLLRASQACLKAMEELAAEVRSIRANLGIPDTPPQASGGKAAEPGNLIQERTYLLDCLLGSIHATITDINLIKCVLQEL